MNALIAILVTSICFLSAFFGMYLKYKADEKMEHEADEMCGNFDDIPHIDSDGPLVDLSEER